MLLRVLDDGMSTRLYHRVCDDKGLCYDVSAGYDGYEDDGVIDFAAGVQHARVSVVTKEILGVLEEIAATGPGDAELAKAKRRHAWDLEALADSAEDTAGFYAGGLLFDRFEDVDQRRESLARVTKEDVQRVAKVYFGANNRTVATLMPENGEKAKE